MRVAVVGPSRFGLGEPFAGGLEAHTATLARALHIGGHEVTVFAGPVDAPHDLPCDVVPIIRRSPVGVARLDTSNPDWFARHEDESYAKVSEFVNEPGRFDVVHNNSLHRRPVDDDGAGTPTVHTLHCPPFDAPRTPTTSSHGAGPSGVSSRCRHDWPPSGVRPPPTSCTTASTWFAGRLPLALSTVHRARARGRVGSSPTRHLTWPSTPQRAPATPSPSPARSTTRSTSTRRSGHA